MNFVFRFDLTYYWTPQKQYEVPQLKTSYNAIGFLTKERNFNAKIQDISLVLIEIWHRRKIYPWFKRKRHNWANK